MSVEEIGGYVRHRDRMIQESVFEDLTDTLIACRWMAGTTTREVADPYNGGWDQVTVTDDQVLKLVNSNPINLIDYFPETEQETENHRTPPNTFACDTGRQANPGIPLELGSRVLEVPYLFNMAFYATSDAIAQAVLNDLRDRYQGRLVRGDYIALYDFNTPGFDLTTPAVVNMFTVSFQYARNTENVAPWEAHLYFAELTVEDIVEG